MKNLNNYNSNLSLNIPEISEADRYLILTTWQGSVSSQINLWKLDENSNIKILYLGILYELNKEIISKSPTLNGLLFGGFTESYQDIIVLDDVGMTRLGWEYCLNYLYNEDNDLVPITYLRSIDITQIFFASDFLQLKELTDQVARKLVRYIDKYLHNIYSININPITYIELINDIFDYIPQKFLIFQYLHPYMLIQLLVIYLNLNKDNDNDGYELVNFINDIFKLDNPEINLSEFSNILQSSYNQLFHYISQKYIFDNLLGENLLIYFLLIVYHNHTFDYILDILKQYVANDYSRILNDSRSRSKIFFKTTLKSFKLTNSWILLTIEKYGSNKVI